MAKDLDKEFDQELDLDAQFSAEEDLDASFEAESPEPVAVEEPGTGEAYLGGLFQDLTMGGMDELKGAVEAAGQVVGIKGLGKEFGQQELQTPLGLDPEAILKAYHTATDVERQRIAGLKEEAPGAFKAGEFTGMLAPAIATGGVGAAKGLLGLTGKQLTKKLAKESGEEITKELLKKSAKEAAKIKQKQLASLAKSGGIMGGLGAAGYSETRALEEPVKFAKEVGTGTALGATIGMATPKAAKLSGEAIKKVGRGIKKASKAMARVTTGFDKKKIEDIIERSGDMKKVIDYPEVQEVIEDKVRGVFSKIGQLSKVANKMLPEEKTIPKELITERIEQRISRIANSEDDSAIPHLQKIIEYIKGKGSKTAPLKDAMEKMNLYKEKLLKEGEKLNQRVNFDPPEIGENHISITAIIDGVPKVKMVPIKKVEIVPSKFEGKNISLKDLYDIVQSTGKRAYRDVAPDAPGASKAQLRETYHELSEILKTMSPNKSFGKIMEDMKYRYDLLDRLEKQLGYRVDYDKIVLDSEDKLMGKLAQVGKETSTKEKTDIEKLLKELEDIQGKESTEMSLSDTLRARKLKNELEAQGDRYSYAARVMGEAAVKTAGIGGAAGGVLGGPMGALMGAGLGFGASPVSKFLLKHSDVTGKWTKAAGEIIDDAVKKGGPYGVGATTLGGAKLAVDNTKTSNKLQDTEYIEGLINEFKEGGNPTMQGYADQLERYKEADTLEEERQIQFNLLQQPTFRKMIKEYEEKKYKKGKKGE